MGEQRGRPFRPAFVPDVGYVDYHIPRLGDLTMSRRLYIGLTTMDAGSDAHAAIRSVHEAEADNPEWDMDEERTVDEWNREFA